MHRRMIAAVLRLLGRNGRIVLCERDDRISTNRLQGVVPIERHELARHAVPIDGSVALPELDRVSAGRGRGRKWLDTRWGVGAGATNDGGGQWKQNSAQHMSLQESVGLG